jgi:hypothetical protein
MSVRSFVRFLIAYVAASIVVLPVSAVASQALKSWGVEWSTWAVAAPVWLLAVGIPSIGWAASRVSSSFGVRPVPMLKLGGWRAIPVAGAAVLADRVRGPDRRLKSVQVPDELVFSCGSYVFPELEVREFLQGAWSRQRAGRRPFSRRYWLDRSPFMGDRQRYDALMLSLSAANIVVGRVPGASGRLLLPPLTALNELRWR